MRFPSVSRLARAAVFTAALAIMLSAWSFAAAGEQNGCAEFYIPPGPETGNFYTGVWTAEGPAFLDHQPLYVKISVQDLGGMGMGKKGNTFKGTEAAFYEFRSDSTSTASIGTFQTTITYVVEHNNDPTKLYMNAVETITPGSGTGRFAGATGTLTDHGTFGVSNTPNPGDGWALLTTHGAICGAR